MEEAIKNSNTTYQTYASENLELSVEYPDNWKISQEAAHHTIFISPDGNAMVLIGTGTVSGNPKSPMALEKYHQLNIDRINNTNTKIFYLDQDTSLSGNPAIKIEYTDRSENATYTDQIYAVKENTNIVYYIICFATYDLDFSYFSYFPIFRHMQESLEIAESQTETNFKKYINHDSGFSFDYPSSWKIEDLSSEVQGESDFINLESPDNNAVIKVITYFNEYPEQSYNMLQQIAIDDFVNDNLDYSLNNDFSFLRGNPASETYAYDSEDDTTKTHILSFDESRIYEIVYLATSAGYFKHRDVLDNIRDSFQSVPIVMYKNEKSPDQDMSMQEMNNNIQMNRFWTDQHSQAWSNLQSGFFR